MCIGSHNNTLANEYSNQANDLTDEQIQLINQYGVPYLQMAMKDAQAQAPVQAGLQGDIKNILGAQGSTIGNASIPTAFQSRDPNNPFTPEELATLQGLGALNSNQQAQTLGGQMSSAAAQRGLTNSSLGNAILPQVEMNRRASLTANNANILGQKINLGSQISNDNMSKLSSLFNMAYSPASSQVSSVTSPLSSLSANAGTMALGYQKQASDESAALGQAIGMAAAAA